ncbi:MAG TPA: hypothetical protein VFX12_04645 [Vicinamibacterales bacterium]|nr:hypothetical protein [Vicinamibacterales bacterium]
MSGFSTTGVLDKRRRAVPSDWLTVASLAILAYATANVLHEALGHGGACLMVGGTPRMLTSVSFDCDPATLSSAGGRVVAAAGTIVNLIVGGAAAIAYRRAVDRGSALRFFLWLFATINLLQGFGYFLFSGVGRIGDWAAVMAGVRPEWVWRVVLSVGGFALYWIATRRAFASLARFIGGRPSDRQPIGTRLALTSYFTGAVLYCVAGALNPAGPMLLLISAAAASLGGTSGLWWGTNFLRGEREEGPSESPARIPQDMRIVAAAGVAALVFVFLLGPGIRMG